MNAALKIVASLIEDAGVKDELMAPTPDAHATEFTDNKGRVWCVKTYEDERYASAEMGPSVRFGRKQPDGYVYWWPAYSALTLLANRTGPWFDESGTPVDGTEGIYMWGYSPESYLPPEVLNATKRWLVAEMPYLAALSKLYLARVASGQILI